MTSFHLPVRVYIEDTDTLKPRSWPAALAAVLADPLASAQLQDAQPQARRGCP